MLKEVDELAFKHLDTIIGTVDAWIKERTLPIDILVNALTQILSLMLRI